LVDLTVSKKEPKTKRFFYKLNGSFYLIFIALLTGEVLFGDSFTCFWSEPHTTVNSLWFSQKKWQP